MLTVLIAVLVPSAALAFILADDQQLPPWAQWGILGLIIVAFVTKQFVPGWQYSDVRSENLELRKDIKALHEKQIEVYGKELVALQEATEALNDNASALRETKDQLREAMNVNRDAMAELRAYRGMAGGRE